MIFLFVLQVIENDFVKVERPREILLKQWLELDLIIFIGSMSSDGKGLAK